MKKKPRIYYKVLSSGRKSAIGVDGTFCLVYHKNKWIVPEIKNSRIFIFNNKENAEEFSRLYMCYKGIIVRCEGKGVVSQFYAEKDLHITFVSIEDFWRIARVIRSRLKEPIKLFECYPAGTLFAKSIKCLD